MNIHVLAFLTLTSLFVLSCASKVPQTKEQQMGQNQHPDVEALAATHRKIETCRQVGFLMHLDLRAIVSEEVLGSFFTSRQLASELTFGDGR